MFNQLKFLLVSGQSINYKLAFAKFGPTNNILLGRTNFCLPNKVKLVEMKLVQANFYLLGETNLGKPNLGKPNIVRDA